MSTELFLLISISFVLFVVFYILILKKNKVEYLKSYEFPASINIYLKEIYPNLTNKDLSIVLDGLRDYFYLYFLSSRRIIVIPSRIIDRALYAFMLESQEYEIFCKDFLGFYLNRPSLKAMNNSIADNDLKIVWTLACDKDEIDPDNPNKLPLLFKLDASFDIFDGIKYTLDASQDRDKYYYAKNIGSLRIYRWGIS